MSTCFMFGRIIAATLASLFLFSAFWLSMQFAFAQASSKPISPRVDNYTVSNLSGQRVGQPAVIISAVNYAVSQKPVTGNVVSDYYTDL